MTAGDSEAPGLGAPFPTEAPLLTTKRLTLRPPTREDSAVLAPIHNDPGVKAGFHTQTDASLENVEAWTVRLAVGARTGRRYGVAIVLTATGKLIGFVELERESSAQNWVDITIALGAAHRHRGYAREAGNAMIDWAFRELDLAKVTGFVLPDNADSLRLMPYMQMVRVGRREIEGRSGGLIRWIEFEITRQDWLERQ